MSHRIAALAGLTFALLVTSVAPALAQAPCRAPALPPSKAANIFTEAQENDLGDAIAERLQYGFRVVDDEALTGYIRAVGTKLISHLPPTALKFQFFLVDLPEANAFVLPGGRIYVSRKLAVFAQSEDELAGVIGHEIGHLVARQQTATMTRQFREVIGVTSVGDRNDIFEKFNRLMDNAARKPKALQQADDHTDQNQVEADRLGLFLVAAAGYDPEAHARLFDRVTETGGRTGGFFSDLFGATSPNSRRLRELIRTSAAVPASCGAKPEASGDAFRTWQTSVIMASAIARKEALHGVTARHDLTPPLRGDLSALRFSPDGRWLLAQDSAGITVLSREPLKTVFHVDAPNAQSPRFSPDSTLLVFHTTDLRVETWDLAAKSIKSAHELVVRDSCFKAALSPTGRVLACLDSDFDLGLFDVTTNARVFEKKAFFRPNILMALSVLLGDVDDDDLRNSIALAFSADGRYFVAGHYEEGIVQMGIGPVEAALVYDMQASTTINLKGNAKKLIAGGFAFVSDTRLIARNPTDVAKSGYVALPSGEAEGVVTLPRGQLESATRGPQLFLRPFQQFAVGVVEVEKAAVTKGSAYAAMDFYQDVFASQRTTGELAVYSVATNQAVGAVTLPRDDLAGVRTAAVSPDLRFLMVSGPSRGALWDLTTGAQVQSMPAFSGVVHGADGQFYADFLRTSAAPRQMIRVDPRTRQAARVGAPPTGGRVLQVGPGLLFTRPLKPGQSMADGFTMEGLDAVTLKSAWTKTFDKEPPRVETDPRGGAVICVWPTSARTVRDRIKNRQRLVAQLSAMKEAEGDYYLEIYDIRDGSVRGQLLVETGKGSFRIEALTVDGDWVVISDTENRVDFYSLETGELKGRVFGHAPVVAGGARVVSVENGPGRVIVYDLATFRPRDEFQFGRRIAFAGFSADGKRLLVVTSDQRAIEVTISAPVSSAPAASAPR